MRSLAFLGLVISVATMSAPALAGGESKTRDAGKSATPAPVPYDYDFGQRGDRVTGAEGTWSGRWEGRYVDGANGRYEGTFRGTYQPPAGTAHPTPLYAGSPYPVSAPGYPAGQPPYAYGYSYPGYGAPVYVPTQPVVTKTITVVEEEIIRD